MSGSDTNLTPAQRALQQLAIRQLSGIQETLRRLVELTSDQADQEAARDASGSVGEAVEVLRDWFGQEPDNDFL